jgi:hypothetical protein
MVQVRASSEAAWQKAAVGMAVGEGAEFRTGPRSAVRVLIPPDQTLTLDRLGTVKLIEAIRNEGRVKTTVGMPYGRTRYDIEQAGLEHESTLVTPSSTLAVRGTVVSVFDQPPFAPSAVSLTGRAVYTAAKRQIAFGGKGRGKTEVSSESASAAQYSLTRTFVDPVSSFGRPEQDQKLINQLTSKGDVLLRNGELAVAFGGPVTDPQLQKFLQGQGRFNIALRWDGPADFDLFVLSSDPKTGLPAYTLGNPSYRGSIFKDIGLFTGTPGVPAVTAAATADGGRIKFDQIALGGGGIELASWNTPAKVPYTVAVAFYDHLNEIPGYPEQANFRVDAFLDGKRVGVLQNYVQVRDLGERPIYGPTYAAGLSLAGGSNGTGIILVRPPEGFPGVIDLTAVDPTISVASPAVAAPPVNSAAVKGSRGKVVPEARAPVGRAAAAAGAARRK